MLFHKNIIRELNSATFVTYLIGVAVSLLVQTKLTLVANPFFSQQELVMKK